MTGEMCCVRVCERSCDYQSPVTPGRVSEVSTDVCCRVDTAAVMKVTERENNTTVMMLVSAARSTAAQIT